MINISVFALVNLRLSLCVWLWVLCCAGFTDCGVGSPGGGEREHSQFLQLNALDRCSSRLSAVSVYGDSRDWRTGSYTEGYTQRDWGQRDMDRQLHWTCTEGYTQRDWGTHLEGRQGTDNYVTARTAGQLGLRTKGTRTKGHGQRDMDRGTWTKGQGQRDSYSVTGGTDDQIAGTRGS
jgi:hypothetical protein